MAVAAKSLQVPEGPPHRDPVAASRGLSRAAALPTAWAAGHIRFRNGYRLVGPRVCWHDAVPSSPLRELGAQPFVPARRSRVGLFPPRRLTSLREPAGGRWAAPGVISFADPCPAASAATPVIGKGALVAKDVDKRRQVWRKTALSGVTPQGPPEQAPGPPEQRSPRRPSIPGCCKQPWN